MDVYNLVSLSGIFVLPGLAWVISRNRRVINKDLIISGIGLQLGFALFVFYVPFGTDIFNAVNTGAVKLIESASKGAEFVFGPLAASPGEEGSIGHILAFQGLPAIIFFSALMSVLYTVGVMPWIIKQFSRFFTRVMKISGAESLCAASNIFVGVESATAVRPFLKGMTKSEICTVLTVGMSTVASNVLALYIATLKSEFSSIAGHLISASFLSAPAGLIMSKLIYPEEETPETLGRNVSPEYDKDSSVFESIINGADTGMKILLGIVALLIAVLGLVELLEMIFSGVGGWINSVFDLQVEWSFKNLLAVIFYPFMLITGIPIQDAWLAASIVGERVVLTEVASYQDLAAALKNSAFTSPRSPVIVSYALCGFAHFASLAIFTGGISAVVPERSKEIADVGLRALVAATLACLMTASVAGTFFTDSWILGS